LPPLPLLLFAFRCMQTQNKTKQIPSAVRMLRAHMQRSLRLQSVTAAWAQPTVTLVQQSHCMQVYVEGSEQSWRSANVRLACGQAYSSSAMASVCWQCGNEVKEGNLFFCSHCKSILPPAAEPDLFKVMGL